MTKYLCDRCGKEVLLQKSLIIVTYTDYPYKEDNQQRAELCERCLKNLKDFLKPLPQIQAG